MRTVLERRVSKIKRECLVCEDTVIDKDDVYFRLICFLKTGFDVINMCHWCHTAYQSVLIRGYKPDLPCDLIELIKFEYELDKKIMQADAEYDEHRELYN